MKINKVLSFLFISVTTAMVMAGCGKDDPIIPGASQPQLTISAPSSSSASAVANGTVAFNVLAESNIVSNSDLSSFTVSRKNVDGSTTALETVTIPNASQKTYGYTKSLEVGGALGDVIFTFSVTDKKGETATLAYTVTVGGAINNYQATLLGDDFSPIPSFYDAINNVRLTQAAAKAAQTSVDILFYYGASNGATLAAPSNSEAGLVYNNASTGLQSYTVRNATAFKEVTLTADAFNAISVDTEITKLVQGAVASDAKQLAVGKAYAFKTASSTGRASKNGIFRVTALTGTSSTESTITFDVKIQQ